MFTTATATPDDDSSPEEVPEYLVGEAIANKMIEIGLWMHDDGVDFSGRWEEWGDENVLYRIYIIQK